MKHVISKHIRRRLGRGLQCMAQALGPEKFPLATFKRQGKLGSSLERSVSAFLKEHDTTTAIRQAIRRDLLNILHDDWAVFGRMGPACGNLAGFKRCLVILEGV